MRKKAKDKGALTSNDKQKVETQVIAVNGNTGVAHWKATFKLQSTGATIALDGAGLAPLRRRAFLSLANRSAGVRRRLLHQVCGYS